MDIYIYIGWNCGQGGTVARRAPGCRRGGGGSGGASFLYLKNGAPQGEAFKDVWAEVIYIYTIYMYIYVYIYRYIRKCIYVARAFLSGLGLTRATYIHIRVNPKITALSSVSGQG